MRSINDWMLSIGQILPLELFHFFEVENTEFERNVFSLFDEGANVCDALN
jgi:hypothetical protein